VLICKARTISAVTEIFGRMVTTDIISHYMKKIKAGLKGLYIGEIAIKYDFIYTYNDYIVNP